MTDDTAAPTVDDLQRVTIVTDGGRGGRGQTVVVFLTPEDTRELLEEAQRRRQL